MTVTTFRRSVVVLGLLALGGLSVLNVVAQTPANRQKVTFIAVGSDGHPIADLKSAQVELKVDGKVRQIQNLQFVTLGGPAAGDTPAATSPAAAGPGLFDSKVDPPFGETPAAAGAAGARNIMIAVDEESLRPGADKPMKDAIEQFLTQLGPADKAGIVGIPKVTTRIDPTTNREAVKEALTRLQGRLPPSRDSTQDRCHTRDALQELTSLMQSLGEGPRSIVVFSSGMVAASADKGECELTSTDFERVRQAASSSQSVVYVVIPETTAAQGELAGLQNLAGNVGSPLLNIASADPPLTRVLRESGNFYVAEIDLEASDRDGKSHRVDVKVNAPGASVRAQNEFAVSKTAGAGAGSKAAKDLVKDGKSYSDLPIRVTGYVSRGAADKLRIIAAVAPVDPAVKLSSVSIGFLDPSNKGQNYNVPSDDLAKPIITAAVDVAPGPWRLHVAAVDATGKAGTADFNVDAQLVPAGPMKMSALVLMGAGPSGVMPKMLFADEAEVIVNFDLYGTTQAGVGYSLDLAQKIDGPAIKTGEMQLGKAADAPDHFTGLGKIDIKDLAPGDYIVRLTFQVQDTEPGKVFRVLRKVK